MNITGPIIKIEDDGKDRDLLNDVFKELKAENEIIFFNDSDLVHEYMIKTDPGPF